MTTQLLFGDCLDIMPELACSSVDAIIADIPYGTTACKWDTVIPFESMWRELKRIIKPRGAIVLFGSQPFTSALVMSNPAWFRYEWVWNKNTGGNFGVLRHQPNRTHESILVFGNGTVKYNPQRQQSISQEAIRSAHSGRTIRRVGSTSRHVDMDMRNGKWQEYVLPTTVQFFESVPRATGSQHPTQKPVALMAYLVKTYTDPGDTVLDFTMGSGTTGVACVETGREFIGIEQDRGYFDIATERIAQAEFKHSPAAVPLFAQAEIAL